MKRNTILISVLGVAGLVAVWWFMLRRASAADPLADTLTGTETSGTATLGSSQLAGGSGTDLLSTLTGLVTALTGKPASGTTSTTPASSTSTWAKVKQGTSNLWTNLTTGQQTNLPAGHNPNRPATLNSLDYAQLAGTTQTTSAPRVLSPKVKPGTVIPVGVVPVYFPFAAPPRTNSPAPVRPTK